MKKTASLLLGALMVLVLCSFVPKDDSNYKVKSRYVFGFSFSYSDSSVYFTDVQCLDSVQIGEHGKLVNAILHMDEKAPHIHAVVAPVIEKSRVHPVTKEPIEIIAPVPDDVIWKSI